MRSSPFGRVLRTWAHVDWVLLGAVALLSLAGLVTMHSFSAENPFFDKQVIWIVAGITLFLIASLVDYHFLRATTPVAIVFGSVVVMLALVFFLGDITKGAQSRFDLGAFAAQPAELAKLVLIIVLAKYFARRHVEIAHYKHIIVSGAYTFILFALIFLQPDLGSAIIIGSIWLGMILVAGISKKHLAMVFILAALTGIGMWTFVLRDYQKERITSFLYPLADIRGAGYNAYQATIAVGSGQIIGKSIGYGTQSKLEFLPEYQTDFIFAAFAEEWGFIGVLLLFGLFGIMFVRILLHALRGASNFETLFASGVAILFLSHFIVHVGMNIGLLPVTGTTIPFMSYGGSHVLTEFLALGMIVGMSKYARSVSAPRATRELGALV
ncbi:rod shape-determining protein RodA [Candidatus Kaiserbacteria bacterium]|nr:rod shape-determining protein RodA [Candidatus Kaiserbacteria bacterium]